MIGAWRITGGLLISFALAVGIAGAAHANDDDDEDKENDLGSISVETWPPTDVLWPPLNPPSDQADVPPPVIPVP